MPKCFCAFVVLKYECEFKVSKLLNTACHGIFAKIQFDARSQQIAPEKKISSSNYYTAKTMDHAWPNFAKPKFASNNQKVTCKPAPTQNWSINLKVIPLYCGK